MCSLQTLGKTMKEVVGFSGYPEVFLDSLSVAIMLHIMHTTLALHSYFRGLVQPNFLANFGDEKLDDSY